MLIGLLGGGLIGSMGIIGILGLMGIIGSIGILGSLGLMGIIGSLGILGLIGLCVPYSSICSALTFSCMNMVALWLNLSGLSVLR